MAISHRSKHRMIHWRSPGRNFYRFGALGIFNHIPNMSSELARRLRFQFQAALGKSQTAWSEQAKALAQQSLNAGLLAAQNSTALLLEEVVRINAAALRKAFEEGVARMEQALTAGRRIAWLSLPASVVALTAAICAIFVRV